MDKYYVSGCKDNGSEIETCDDSEATFWTLYERDEKGLSQGIVDLRFREDAEAVMAVYVERDALQEQVKALAAENATFIGWIEMDSMVAVDKSDMPATDAVIREIVNNSRAEGIHFAANRLLAAWESGFVDDTPAMAHDISGAVLSAVEFLPNANEGEFKRDYADEVRASIAAQLRAKPEGEQP